MGPYPSIPVDKPDPASEEKINAALKGSLLGWERLVSPLPEDESKVRDELFRRFSFKTFADAIRFMNHVAPGCDIAGHHPRWVNIWKTIDVYLATWDIEHKISDRDIQLAKYFQLAYQEFPGAKAIDNSAFFLYVAVKGPSCRQRDRRSLLKVGSRDNGRPTVTGHHVLGATAARNWNEAMVDAGRNTCAMR